MTTASKPKEMRRILVCSAEMIAPRSVSYNFYKFISSFCIFHKVDCAQRVRAAHQGRSGVRLDGTAVIAAVKDVVSLQRLDDFWIQQELSLGVRGFHGVVDGGTARIRHDRPRRAQIIQ